MRSVRRLYFYLVTLISLEVVIWGVITLLRTLFDNLISDSNANLLSRGLSQVLVGVPLFILHWRIIQREYARDPEEGYTRLRALFLYGTRAAVLFPVAQNVLAIFNRMFFRLLGSSIERALIGAQQTLIDNLLAIGFNLLIWLYFENILKKEWQESAASKENLIEIRRLYRYAWVLYALILTLAGAQQVFRYSFFTVQENTVFSVEWLADGLTLLLVGAPLWAWTWQNIQRSLSQPEEQNAFLRLLILYTLTLIGIVTTLSAVGIVLSGLLSWILGEAQTVTSFISGNSSALATAIPFGVLWAYYAQQLRQEFDSQSDVERRAVERSVYHYILSFLGSAATLWGIWQLLGTVVDMLLSDLTNAIVLRAPISGALAALLVGIPVWLINWRPMEEEAAASSETGSQARRSSIRKGYLYLILFLTVVGSMASMGSLLYAILNQVLGENNPTFWLDTTHLAVTLLPIASWLLYHLFALQRDGRLIQKELEEQHASFPVLVILSRQDPYGEALKESFQRHLPNLPVTLHYLDDVPLPDDSQKSKAVILPAGLAARPSAALHNWLESFQGRRIVVPLSETGWIWLGTAPKSTRELAKETVLTIRQLAEDQSVRAAVQTNPWVIVGYILAGLFGLQVIFVLLSIVISTLN